MKLRRRLASSLGNLFAHRGRTALALSGVAVGVAAVVVSGAIGAGAEHEMLRTVERTGTNLLIVKPLPVKRPVARPTVGGLARTLTGSDSDAVADLGLVAAVAPSLDGVAKVKAGRITTSTTVRGTTRVFPEVRRFEIAAGRFFDDDERSARRVAVLGSRVAAALAPGRSLVGSEIRLRGVPFEVVGVLRPKGSTPDGADQDGQVLVPLRTAQRRIFNVTWLTTLYTSAESPDRMDEAAGAIARLLRRRHRLGDDKPDDFAIQNTAKSRSIQQELVRSLSRYTSGIAAIALLVGGIGILALMLLSVRERTGEIGLRMAVGAQPRDILLQFLLEAAALALVGWLAGAALGGATALAVALATAWTVGMPTTALVASFAMVAIIGLGFGSVPARSAARIPPIQALQRP